MKVRLFVFLALIACACQIVIGLDDVAKVPAPPAEEAGIVTDAGIPDPCGHVRPPPPPATDDDRTTVIPPFYVAVRTVTFDPDGGGYDLDGTCTCDTRVGSAFDGGASCRPASSRCDRDGGVDVEIGAFGGLSGDAIDFNEVTASLSRGTRSVLMQIRNWNGKPNDRDVTFGLVSSSGINDPSGCGDPSPPDSGSKLHPPQWCGKDKWDYLPNSTTSIEGVVSPAYRGPAYIVDNQLVYQSEGSVSIFLGDGTITFGSPIVTGKIETLDDGRRRLSGVIAGRVASSDLLATVGQFRHLQDSGKTNQICETSIFPLLRAGLCSGLDIMHSSSLDFSGSDCDAVSSAINFVAEEAQLGGEDPTPPAPNACDPTRVPDASIYLCP